MLHEPKKPLIEVEIERFFEQVDPKRKMSASGLKQAFDMLVLPHLDSLNRSAIEDIGHELADKWCSSANKISGWARLREILGKDAVHRIFPGVTTG